MKQIRLLACFRASIQFFVAFSLLVLSPARLSAQQNGPATLNGNVLDASGSAIRNSTVVVTNDSTSQASKTTTDQQGHFSVTGLAPGQYTVETSAPGFAADIRKGMQLSSDRAEEIIDFDGVPFYDTNTPTHHTWAFFPDPWVGGVDFDRSPGSASTIGPTPFGGSIHLLSPELKTGPLLNASISYGSFGTVLFDTNFDSGQRGSLSLRCRRRVPSLGFGAREPRRCRR